MSDLDRVIDVTVSAETKAISERSFGIAGLACYHTQYPDRSKFYAAASALTEMVADGFDVTGPSSAPYRMAEALLAQSPAPDGLKILRRALPSTQKIRVVATITTSGAINSFVFSGSPVSVTNGGSETATTIATAWKAIVDALSLDATTAVVTAGLEITSDNAGEIFELTELSGGVQASLINVDPGIATDLAAIELADSDWYHLHLDSESEAEIAAAAAWAEAAKKVYIPTTSDTLCRSSGSTTDVMADVETASYKRTGVLYHSGVNGYAGVAWSGVMLAMPPGSYTGKFKTLAGVTIDVFTAAELATVKAKHGNCYPSLGGNGSTEEGWAGDGTFLDQTRFLDWLVSQIQTEIALLLVNSPKIPFTDSGIARVEKAFRAAVQRGVNAGGIDEGRLIKYTIPKRADISANDAALRQLNGLIVEFYLAGAIHAVGIAVKAVL